MDIKEKPLKKPSQSKSTGNIPVKFKEAAVRGKEFAEEPERQETTPSQYAQGQITEKGESAARRVMDKARPHLRQPRTVGTKDVRPPSGFQQNPEPAGEKPARHRPPPPPKKEGIREKQAEIREKPSTVRELDKGIGERESPALSSREKPSARAFRQKRAEAASRMQPEIPQPDTVEPALEAPSLPSPQPRTEHPLLKSREHRKAAVKERLAIRETRDFNVSIPKSAHLGETPVPLQTPDVPARRLSEKHLRKPIGRPAKPMDKTASRGAKKSVKTAKSSVKAAGRTVKTAGRTVKTTAKTAKTAAQTAAKTAQAAKAAAKTAATAVKLTAKAIVAAVKAIISAVKALIEVIAAGGWVAVVVILVIALIGVIFCSPFGIFTGGDPSMPTTAVIEQLNQEKAARIQQIKEKETPDRTTVQYRGAEDGGAINNWVDILAVYAVRTGLDPDSASSVLAWDEEHIAMLRAVYWDMTTLSYEILPYTMDYDDGSSETLRELSITIDCKAYTDMAQIYAFTPEQRETLRELMKPDYAPLWEAAVSVRPPPGPSPEEIGDILDQLPEGLDLQRQGVIEAALSIKGQVHYFWGGKSTAVGWDNRWGTPMEVTAPGENSTGTTRPFGLDCSGYVAWAFINGGQDSHIGAVMGFSTSDQWQRSLPLNWSAAEPGDLVFFAPPGERQYNHVGVIVGEENGDYLVAHCASGQDNVVVTSARGVGFRYARRPVIYTAP